MEKYVICNDCGNNVFYSDNGNNSIVCPYCYVNISLITPTHQPPPYVQNIPTPQVENIPPYVKNIPTSQVENIPPYVKNIPTPQVENIPPYIENIPTSQVENIPPYVENIPTSQVENIPPYVENIPTTQVENVTPYVKNISTPQVENKPSKLEYVRIIEEDDMEEFPSIIQLDNDDESLIKKYFDNKIYSNTQIIVEENQEVLLVDFDKVLVAYQTGEHLIKSHHIQLFSNSFETEENDATMLFCHIYFINLNKQKNSKWGSDSKIQIFDNNISINSNIIEIGASGSYDLQVIDSKKLILKLLEIKADLSVNITFSYIKLLVINQIKNYFPQIISKLNLDITQENSIILLQQEVKVYLNKAFAVLGIEFSDFYVKTIMLPNGIVNSYQDITVIDEIINSSINTITRNISTHRNVEYNFTGGDNIKILEAFNKKYKSKKP